MRAGSSPVPGTTSLLMHNFDDRRLYGILDLGYVERDQIRHTTELMLEGGVDILQLRAKGFEAEEIAEMAREVLPLTADAGTPLIINDFDTICELIGADGFHVGQDDSYSADPTNVIVGRSTHSLDQARSAAAEPGVDYIGFGPIFATPTKPDYTPIGKEDIAQVHREVSIPIFCIGGIKRENAEQILQAGASRLVIVSGILQAPDMVGYIRDVRQILDSHAQP